MALKAIFEPAHIDIFHRVPGDITAPIAAGTFVMKDEDDAELVEVSDGTAFWGILSQDVYLNPGDKFTLPHMNFEAYPGDQVGIYTEPGYFKTDQYVSGTYTPGADLYVTSEGKLTDVLDDTEEAPAPSKKTGTLKVGNVVKKDVDGLFFYFIGL